ncbi:hypothetical protein IWX90DRAFT_3870 [Phyllosticta citrichinensis]|uniref:Uncharacterized protein n=1 Tax=Phyllosticta citrichinensis TaxID=1130410 RepID=A0ABR1Y500_9PEZI
MKVGTIVSVSASSTFHPPDHAYPHHIFAHASQSPPNMSKMKLLLCIFVLFLASVRNAYAARGCNQMRAECTLVVGIGIAESCANRCQEFASLVYQKALNYCVGRDGMTQVFVKSDPKIMGNPPIKVCTCLTQHTVWRLSRGCDTDNYINEVCLTGAGATFGDSDISVHNVHC